MIRLVVALVAAGCGSPRASAPEPPPPAVATASEPAGPRRTAELDDLFGERLPRWVVELNQETPGGPRALSEAAAGLLPAPVARAFDEVLEAARAARGAAEPDLDAAADRLDEAVADLDERLAGAGLGYVIDASVVSSGDSRSVLLFSFAVDRSRRYRSGDAGYRALWVTRIDRLAFRYTLVGLAAQRRDVLILTAQIDEWLISEILPALADSTRWGKRHEASGELARAIGPALESELSAAGGAGLGELAAALEARARLFDEIAERLAERGITVERPASLTLDREWRTALESGLTASERERLATIETRLAELEVRLAYNRVRELAIASVEHHEIQHQLDAGAELSAGDLVDHLGPAAAEIAAREHSAYLAQIARHPASARLSLVKLAGFALTARTPAVERLISARIIAALARRLGLDADAGSAEEISVAAAALVSRDGAELAGAAAAVYEQRFGRPVAPLALER